jgi:hypothetical protein
MIFEKVIFAIDGNTDTHIVAKFMRLMDTRRALGDLQGRVVQCIGMWTDGEGRRHMEPSYMVDARDYYQIVKPSGYVDHQECALKVPGDTRKPCTLEFPSGVTFGLKPMREIGGPDGVTDWTYVIETGRYFTC